MRETNPAPTEERARLLAGASHAPEPPAEWLAPLMYRSAPGHTGGMIRPVSNGPTRTESNKSYNNNPFWILIVLQQFARVIKYFVIGLWLMLKGLVCRRGRTVRVTKEKSRSTGYSAPGQKRVLFVRHAQGYHNESMKGWQLTDPMLTAKGEAQVRQLNRELREEGEFPNIELIVTSPLTRAIQTATGGFDGCAAPYYVQPLLRERLGAPCDEGLPKTELLETIPEIRKWAGVDDLDEKWWSTENDPLYERMEELKARSRSRRISRRIALGARTIRCTSGSRSSRRDLDLGEHLGE